jgi:Flp pilus assembly protein TadD
LAAIQQGLREGYPTAFLWNEAGALYFLMGRTEEARAAFLRAIHSPVNQTGAGFNLTRLAPEN